MAIARSGLAALSAPSDSHDLRTSLTLKVVAVALGCFLVAAALTFLGTYRELQRANARVADIVQRQLQVQIFRIESDVDTSARFPDWDPVADMVLNAGQCVQYITPERTIARSSCMSGDGSSGHVPVWIAPLGAWLPDTSTQVPVLNRGKTFGTLRVTTETNTVLAALWQKVSGLVGLTALLIGAICLLQYVVIGRALRPTREILAGLDKLGQGDLSCRLPRFRLIELQRISEVFNALAANLELTTRERTALAARLVDGQEQERSRLARELHDELAQNLSAVSAAAASIKTTAETDYPALQAEATRLSETSLAMMRSLRVTLQNLRPPEIDDFGLAASLATLASDRERQAGGALKILIDMDEALDELPPSMAAHVYRIVQEALTNVGKHANASRARVSLHLRPQHREQQNCCRRWLELEIEDDGSRPATNGKAPAGSGLGLVGMRERAMALGGRLDVVQAESGFKLQAQIPFAAEAEASP